jgi:hypothetical protein
VGASNGYNATAAIETGEPGEVIVVEQRARPDGPGRGGILSCAARVRNLARAIVDIDESRRVDFPCLAGVRCRPPLAGELSRRVQRFGDDRNRQGRAGGFGACRRQRDRFPRSRRGWSCSRHSREPSHKGSATVASIRAGTPVSRVMAGNCERKLEDGGNVGGPKCGRRGGQSWRSVVASKCRACITA